MANRPSVGIGVLIFNKQNEILLGKRLSSHGEHSWAPPGGHLEFGETLEACAIREAYEETGLHIQTPNLVSLSNDCFEKEQKHYISIFMQTHFPEGQHVCNREPHKTISWQWFSLDDLPQKLFLPLAKLVKKDCYFMESLSAFS